MTGFIDKSISRLVWFLLAKDAEEAGFYETLFLSQKNDVLDDTQRYVGSNGEKFEFENFSIIRSQLQKCSRMLLHQL